MRGRVLVLATAIAGVAVGLAVGVWGLAGGHAWGLILLAQAAWGVYVLAPTVDRVVRRHFGGW